MSRTAVLGLLLALVSFCASQQLENPVLDALLQQYRAQSGGAMTTSAAPDTTVRPRGRIIGGSRITDRCKAPYNAMVALQLLPDDPNLKITYCSGVMLSADLIVTAGLCLFPYITFQEPVLTAVIGEKHFDFIDNNQVNVPVTNFKVHPDYDSATGDNNIALIKLAAPVTLNDCVQPIARYVRDNSVCSSSLMNCTITGWGPFENGDLVVNSRNPLYGNVRLIDENISTLLSAQGAYPTSLRQGALYAVPFPDSPIRACLLDWGGMVACNLDGDWVLRGVIGEDNCEGATGVSGAPIMVTNLEKYSNWIDSCTTNFDSSSCEAYTVA